MTSQSLQENKNIKVALGMSGGVDSSVAAYLLKEQGYDVTGVYMQCWEAKADGCRADEDRRDALEVAAKLDIPFTSLDFIHEYKSRVISYFYDEYRAGRTPNPDVMCNKEIKFGMFLDWAEKEGFDFVATGHYARVDSAVATGAENAGEIEYKLLKGLDPKKDQSYFLYLLGQEQLKKTMFPLGNLEKTEIRKIAKEQGFHNAEKPDSVGICFIGEVDMKEFLKKEIDPQVGPVVNAKGEVIGEHEGVWYYTIGQRHGFKVNIYTGMPMYVIGKNVEKNELIVGFASEVNCQEFDVIDIHWVSGKEPSTLSDDGLHCDVRVRHLGELHPSFVTKELNKIVSSGSDVNGERLHVSLQVSDKPILNLDTAGRSNELRLHVRFDEETFGIAPGQSAVFYIDDELIGGGIIA